MSRLWLVLLYAMLVLIGIPSRAVASGQDVLVVLLFAPAAVEFIEGMIIGIMIVRRWGTVVGAIAIAAFVGGVWAFWWFTFSSEFYSGWVSRVTSFWPVPEDAVVLPTLWLLALLAGPVPAIIVALAVSRMLPRS